MSQKYLEEAPTVEAMTVFYSDTKVEPLKHRIWTSDFMAACTHDIACPVCFNAHAVIQRNVTPGQWDQSVQPCRACQKLRYRVVKIPKWMFSLGFFH